MKQHDQTASRRQSWRDRIAAIATVVALIVASFWAAPAVVLAESAVPDVDVKAFGELPAWFNGRLTTWDTVARATLKRISGREIWFDDDNHEQLAIRWMLEMAAGARVSKDRKIVPIEDPALLSLFHLTARVAPAGQVSRYSPNEIWPHIVAFDAQAAPLRMMASGDLRPASIPITTLDDRLGAIVSLSWSFGLALIEGQDLAAQLEQAREIQRHGLPAVVPPAQPRGQWTTLRLASMMARADEAQKPGIAPPPLFVKLVQVLADFEKDDAQSFARDVAEYRHAVDKSGILKDDPSAAHFSVPDSWKEAGASNTRELDYYGDVRAYGRVVAAFQVDSAPRSALVQVHEFVLPIAPTGEIVNNWRMTAGLAPLPDARAAEIPQPARVAGRQGVRISIVTSPGSTLAPEQTLSYVFWDTHRAWEIAIYGTPSVVNRETANFEAFIKSLQVGPDKPIDQPFAAGILHDKTDPVRLLGAVAVDGLRIWTVRFVGPAGAIASHKEKFAAFVASLRMSSRPDGTPVLNWSRPEGFQPYDSSQREYASFLGGTRDELVCVYVNLYILSEPEVVDDVAARVINVWRAEFGDEPEDIAKITPHLGHMKAGDTQAAIIDMPPRAVNGAVADATSPKPAYVLPPGWHEEPPALGGLRFSVGGKDNPVTIIVIMLSKAAPIAANLARWRMSIGLPPTTDDEVRNSAMPITIDGVVGQSFDLLNEQKPARRLKAAIIPRDGQTWYFRISGPAELVEQQAGAYKAFLSSFKFPAK